MNKVFAITRANGHVNPDTNKQIFEQPMMACSSLEVAKREIGHNSLSEYSKWFRKENNPDYIIHYIYQTWTWADGLKSFTTWVVIETTIRG